MSLRKFVRANKSSPPTNTAGDRQNLTDTVVVDEDLDDLLDQLGAGSSTESESSDSSPILSEDDRPLVPAKNPKILIFLNILSYKNTTTERQNFFNFFFFWIYEGAINLEKSKLLEKSFAFPWWYSFFRIY